MIDERTTLTGTLLRKGERSKVPEAVVGGAYLRTDKGEDAEPIAITNELRTVLMVADGLGGAGNARVQLADGTVTTEAYLAAHGLRQKLFDLATNEMTLPKYDRASQLAQWVQSSVIMPLMESLNEQFPRGDKTIKGSIRKRFPTTLSMAVVENRDIIRRVNVVWAGDSICVVMSRDNIWTNFQADAGDAPMRDLVDVRAALPKSQSIEVATEIPLVVACFTDGLLLLNNFEEIKRLLLETAKSGEPDVMKKFKELLYKTPVESGLDDTTIAMATFGKWSA